MATRPPRVGIGMADCSNNKTEYITQRGSKGNRISQMVSGYDGTASRRAVGCSDSGASGRGEEQDGTKAPKPIKVWRMPLGFLPALLFLPSSAALEARARGTSGAKERLAGVPSRRKNNSQGRHNASAAAWLQSQRKRDASCSSPPLDSANLWC